MNGTSYRMVPGMVPVTEWFVLRNGTRYRMVPGMVRVTEWYPLPNGTRYGMVRFTLLTYVGSKYSVLVC